MTAPVIDHLTTFGARELPVDVTIARRTTRDLAIASAPWRSQMVNVSSVTSVTRP